MNQLIYIYNDKELGVLKNAKQHFISGQGLLFYEAQVCPIGVSINYNHFTQFSLEQFESPIVSNSHTALDHEVYGETLVRFCTMRNTGII